MPHPGVFYYETFWICTQYIALLDTMTNQSYAQAHVSKKGLMTMEAHQHRRNTSMIFPGLTWRQTAKPQLPLLVQSLFCIDILLNLMFAIRLDCLYKKLMFLCQIIQTILVSWAWFHRWASLGGSISFNKSQTTRKKGSKTKQNSWEGLVLHILILIQ